jgi:hypothetical protein
MSAWDRLQHAHGEFTCHINHPFLGCPISVYPCARLRARSDVRSHAAATNDNPASTSRANTKVKKRFAGQFYRGFRWWQWDGEKP